MCLVKKRKRKENNFSIVNYYACFRKWGYEPMLPWITGELGFMDSLFPQSQFQSLSLRIDVLLDWICFLCLKICKFCIRKPLNVSLLFYLMCNWKNQQLIEILREKQVALAYCINIIGGGYLPKWTMKQSSSTKQKPM